jgi:sigma-B regulation protein RsbU (phosphoserine phosphatase)
MPRDTSKGAPISKFEKLERDLNLKQLQIRSLLAITQAINDNISAAGLYNMYKSFLNWDMNIHKMALLIKDSDRWILGASINVDYPVAKPEVLEILMKHKRLYTIDGEEKHPILKEFDMVVPVYHKDTPLAYTLIGGVEGVNDIYNKVQFITTITNIIAVAIENKRLFKKQIEQERLKKAFELAEEVQQMLIPDSFPKEDTFEMDSIYRPHFNVGGDYLDYFYFNEDVFAFCIADISGKGVAAALLMANFQALLRAHLKFDSKLDEIVRELNEAIYRITKSDKFISFFIGRVNLKTRKLSSVNAGHCPPLLYQDGRTITLNKGCPILGAVERLDEIEVETIDIAPESILISYTDGLVDLKNESGEYFDEDHLKVFVLTHHHLTTSKFNKQLLKRLERFKGTQAFPDDIAILTCKIK